MSEAQSSGAGCEMPRYKSHKEVWALEIKAIEQSPADEVNKVGGTWRLIVEDQGYAPVTVPHEMFLRYKPVPGDFYVVYADGYKSFSPRKAFLDGYTRA